MFIKRKRIFLAVFFIVCFTFFTASANSIEKVSFNTNEISAKMTLADKELEYLYSTDCNGNLLDDSELTITPNSNNQYNIYVDENKREYTFKQGESTPCAVQEELYYGDQVNNMISEQEAINVASAYLSPLIPNFTEYTLLSNDYYEQDAVFCVRYGYKKYNYWTDDVIAVFIKANGQVGGYSALQLGAFVDCEISYDKLQAAESDLDTLINERQAELILCGMVFDEEGKLNLAAALTIENKTGITYFPLE